MAFEALGFSSPVPAFEALLDRVPDELVEAESGHEFVRGAPVALDVDAATRRPPLRNAGTMPTR